MIFTTGFFIALNDWQKGWREEQEKRRKIADELVKQCEKLPIEFKHCKVPCFRKRFIIDGEIVPILLDDEKFEGIASWTTDLDYVKKFKGFIKPNTKFAVVFKHIPEQNEIVLNVSSLWNNSDFKEALAKFKETDPENSKALYNFQDYQSEIILRSTLKGSEIENIVGMSSSFEKICDMAQIPEEKRQDFSISYARNPEGIPIEVPILAQSIITKEAIKKTLSKMKDLLKYAAINNIPIIWGNSYSNNEDDLKHKPIKSS